MSAAGVWVRRLRRFLKARSIQFMLSVCFTFIAIVGMIFLGLALYLRFTASTREMVQDDNRRVIDQVNLNLDVYLRNMMRVSDAMYYRVIKNTDLEGGSLEGPMNLLYEANRDLLVSIAVFDEGGALVAASPLSQLKPIARPAQEEWFVRATQRIENLHFSSPHVQNLFVDPDYRYRWVISLSRAVELTSGGAIRHGVLLVDMNFSGIERLLKDVNLGGAGYVYLVDSGGEIIYHPHQQLLYAGLRQENNRAAAGYEDGTHLESFAGQERSITVKTVGYTGWKIVGVMPLRAILSFNSDIRAFVVFILLFTIFLLSFANMYVSSRIADPIKALEKSVKELEKGRLDAEIAIGGSYEVRHLGTTIKSMVVQMRRLMRDMVAEQESKRRSELDALQSQINPHFLYNTLDSIVWMIENERYPEAIAMVTSLARLFRISLSKGRNIIPVADELEHARHYMNIQSMRYKNRFTFSIQAGPEVLGLSTIKLIVQPLVENAIYHGMEFMDGEGEIAVHAFLEGDAFYIDVCDNGAGIPAKKCAALLTDESRPRSKGSGIGLRNVHERIVLCYGPGYGLQIASEPDVGTRVRIHLPRVPYAPQGREGGKA